MVDDGNLTLQEISEKYPVILVDTSALFNCFNPVRGNKRYGQRRIDLVGTFEDYFNFGTEFYMTPMTLGEILPHFRKGGSPLWHIGKMASKAEYRLANQLIRRNRFFGKDVKQKDDDKESFSNMDIKEQGIYSLLVRCYKKIRARKLSEPDFDVLVSGAAKSQTANCCPVALISDDFPLLFTWQRAVNQGEVTREELYAFTRVDADSFVRADIILQDINS